MGRPITKGKSEFTCQVCGKVFQSWNPRKYCSRQCYHVANREALIKRNKEIAGNAEFRKKLSESHAGHTHSEETKRAIGAKSREAWERTRERRLQIAKDNGAKLRTGTNLYGGEFRKLRSEIGEGAWCLRCGSTENIQIHHFKKIIFGGLHERQNLGPICEHCHRLVEYETEKIIEIVGDIDLAVSIVKGALEYGIQTGFKNRICAS